VEFKNSQLSTFNSQFEKVAREKPPEAGVPEWILTYGDMMSLLLCFFIMLYAISTLEVVKVQAAVESLREGFGYQGASQAPQANSANATRQRINSSGRSKRLDVLRGGQKVAAPQGDNPTVTTIKPGEEPIKGGIIRFDIGSDELNAQARKDLDVIYDQLAGSPFKIKIKGHAATDEKGAYRLVDDKAYARAINVRDYLVGKGLKRQYFEVSEVAAYEPLGRSNIAEQADPQLVNAYVEVMLLSTYLRDAEGDKTERDLKYLDDIPIR